MNLIGNGIKFTDHGEVSVNVSIADPDHPCDDGGPIKILFSVRDTGVGIAQEKQAAVLEAFTQADTSTTRRYGGTGLGLAISKQLVELMDGELMLESELGVGTTFSFIATFEVAPEQRTDSGDRIESLNDIPVLVVDDNSTNRRILEEIFTAWRLEPTMSEDASSAIKAYRASYDTDRPFQLVVLDCMMPGTDGFELARQIREHDVEHKTVIIMLSSAQRPDDSQRCKEVGIERFMTKPVIQSELLDTVLDVMEVDTGVMKSEPVFEAVAAPMRVLVAEDGLANQHVAVGMLQAAGHQAFVAVDGREAIQRWESESFDLILMDMHMPVMDGIEATEAIRERERATGGHIPIIAVTAAAMSEDARACREAGMDDYLTKPIAPAQLREILNKYAPASREDSSESRAYAGPRKTPLQHNEQSLGEPTTDAPYVSCASSDRPDPEVVDFEATAARVPGGMDGARTLAEVFQDECNSIMESLRESIPARDTKEVRRAAHTLKGSANLFAAKRVYEAAQAIEQRAVNDEIDSTEALLPKLEEEVAVLMKCLKQFIG